MPKPNYQFEKRKRDLEKKAKKNEKKLRKIQRADAATTPSTPEDEANSVTKPEDQ